jgi:hypothetical protein
MCAYWGNVACYQGLGRKITIHNPFKFWFCPPSLNSLAGYDQYQQPRTGRLCSLSLLNEINMAFPLAVVIDRRFNNRKR